MGSSCSGRRTNRHPEPLQLASRRGTVGYMSQQHQNGSKSAQGRPMLKPEEVAERLNVSLRFIRRLCHERRVPYTKVGKFVRFDADELEAWIATQRVVPRD
jgi:excisionase family DNA binding protein